MTTETQNRNATDILAQRAVLAGVTIRMWHAQVLDRKVTAETNRAHGAAEDAGKYRKQLVPKDALEPVRAAAGRIRQVVYEKTLPWTDEGLRVLPVPSVESFGEELGAAIADFNAAVTAFEEGYVDMRAAAKGRLGDMFDPNEYPDEIASKFSVTRRMVPIPTADDFRCHMGAEALEAARKALEAQNRAALRVAILDAWNQARKVTATMAEKLRQYSPEREGEKARGIFRDSLVSNVIEIALRLPNLNLEQDARMVELADRMETDLAYFSADDLRRDDAAREQVILSAERIVSEIDAIVGAM